MRRIGRRVLRVARRRAGQVKRAGVRMTRNLRATPVRPAAAPGAPAPTPSVSVVVTAYNIEAYIERALASIADQGYRPLEVIVVDDGSSDATVERAATFLRSMPRAHLITQDNGGPGAARNQGLRAATGEFVLFLDGDDWLQPGAIARLAAASDGVDLVLSNRRRYWERRGRYVNNIMFTDKTRVPLSAAPEVLSIMAVHGKLYRRSVLVDNEVTFPTHMTSEDYVFSYRAYAATGRVSTISDVTYNYRKRADEENRSITQQRLSEFNLTSRIRQIEMTVDVVERSNLQKTFPRTKFLRLDYDTRLMRHLTALPRETDPARRAEVLALVREFLTKHREAALGAARPTTRKVYEAILAGDDDAALARIEEKVALEQATGKAA